MITETQPITATLSTSDGITVSGVADWVGIIGFVLSIIGFLIAIIQIRRVATASIASSQALTKLRGAVLHMTAIEDLASAVSTLEQIQEDQSANSWAKVPKQYSAVRRRVSSVRVANPKLTDTQKTALIGVADQLRTSATRIERYLQTGKGTLDAAGLNEIVSQQIDILDEVLIEARRTIGEEL